MWPYHCYSDAMCLCSLETIQSVMSASSDELGMDFNRAEWKYTRRRFVLNVDTNLFEAKHLSTGRLQRRRYWSYSGLLLNCNTAAVCSWFQNTDASKSVLFNTGPSPNCVERICHFKCLGLPLDDDLSWKTNTTALIKKAQQRLHTLTKELLVSF